MKDFIYAALPWIIIGLTIVAIGLAVGTGVYFGTKKRTKLYKI